MSSAPPLSAQDANARAIALMQQQDFAGARRLFALAVEADPHAGPLWRNLAHACRELGDAAGEREALTRALEIDRMDLSALIRLAELHERTGDAREAMVTWEGVIGLSRGMGVLPADLQRIVAHAQDYCERQRAKMASVVTDQLSASLGALAGGSRRRAEAFIDHAVNGRRIYRNECAGLYYPFLPADEYFDEEHFPWFADLAQATGAIRAELEALMAHPDDAIRPYVTMDKGTPTNKWSPLDGSLDWGACFLWEYGRPNAAVLQRCPATAAALAATPSAHIPGRAPSAFFSMLKPRTRIPPHTGVSNTRAIIHLPLIVPPGCGFRVGGETRQWVEGVPFAFDDTIEHEAWNDSDQLRAVLIFDVWNPHLTVEEQQVIAQFYTAVDDSGMEAAVG